VAEFHVKDNEGSLPFGWWLPLDVIGYIGVDEAPQTNAGCSKSAREHPYRTIQPLLTTSQLTLQD